MPTSNRMEYLSGLLKELRQLPEETEWVEFKCNNTNPEDIGEYVSALSNSAVLQGKANAYIVWGVKDGSHEIIGTSFRPRQNRKGNEELENWLIQHLTPRIYFHFIEFDVDNNHIVMMEIPRASHQPIQFKGIEYIRIGSYKKKLKDYTEIERKLWRLFDTVPFENQVAIESVEEDDVLTLLDYPVYFKLLELPLPDNRSGILKRLADDHMIRPRNKGFWDILNLGAILLATDLAKFRHLARKAVRMVKYEGEGRIQTEREFQGNKGYASGFERLIGFLKNLLPENEVIGEALRKSIPMYPEAAIRELVANMIIHQDFSMTGTGPMIEIFDSRLEITNPGTPLIDPQRFLDTPPQSRNEALASFMRRIGICEERGSGIDKVVLQTEFFQLPAPLFEIVEKHTRATLFAHKPFSAMDKQDRIRACYLHACLQYVKRDALTNTSLRERFGIDEKNRAQVSRVIGETLEVNLIKSCNPESDSRRHARYVPFWA